MYVLDSIFGRICHPFLKYEKNTYAYVRHGSLMRKRRLRLGPLPRPAQARRRCRRRRQGPPPPRRPVLCLRRPPQGRRGGRGLEEEDWADCCGEEEAARRPGEPAPLDWRAASREGMGVTKAPRGGRNRARVRARRAAGRSGGGDPPAAGRQRGAA